MSVKITEEFTLTFSNKELSDILHKAIREDLVKRGYDVAKTEGKVFFQHNIYGEVLGFEADVRVIE